MLGRANNHQSKLPLVNTSPQNTENSADDNHLDIFNLTDHLIVNPDDTYYFQILGHSMIGLGIYDKDILIVDRSLKPIHEDIVILFKNNELVCKRLEIINGSAYLIPNEFVHSSLQTDSKTCYIWGIVTHNIHTVRHKL